MSEKEQKSLFENMDDFNHWNKHWKNMPEFKNEDVKPYLTVKLHLLTKEAKEKFAELIDQTITEKTQYINYPKKDFSPKEYLYVNEDENES
jgi:hypothetical protein